MNDVIDRLLNMNDEIEYIKTFLDPDSFEIEQSLDIQSSIENIIYKLRIIRGDFKC